MNVNNQSIKNKRNKYDVNLLINEDLYCNRLFKKIIIKYILILFKSKKIIFYNQNNWSSIFTKVDTTKITFIVDQDGFLPFLFFSKQKNCVVSMPNDPSSAYLSRAHNNSMVCILALNNIKPFDINDIIDKY